MAIAAAELIGLFLMFGDSFSAYLEAFILV
jgi:hypothetical protein